MTIQDLVSIIFLCVFFVGAIAVSVGDLKSFQQVPHSLIGASQPQHLSSSFPVSISESSVGSSAGAWLIMNAAKENVSNLVVSNTNTSVSRLSIVKLR